MSDVWRDVQGTVLDTNSKKRFDLLLMEDGILGIPGTYDSETAWKNDPAARAQGSTATKERQRIAGLLSGADFETVIADPASLWYPKEAITDIRLKMGIVEAKVWICTEAEPEGRRFGWLPASSPYEQVRADLQRLYGPLVTLI